MQKKRIEVSKYMDTFPIFRVAEKRVTFYGSKIQLSKDCGYFFTGNLWNFSEKQNNKRIV